MASAGRGKVELLLYFFAQKHRDIKLHHNYLVLNETKDLISLSLWICLAVDENGWKERT